MKKHVFKVHFPEASILHQEHFSLGSPPTRTWIALPIELVLGLLARDPAKSLLGSMFKMGMPHMEQYLASGFSTL